MNEGPGTTINIRNEGSGTRGSKKSGAKSQISTQITKSQISTQITKSRGPRTMSQDQVTKEDSRDQGSRYRQKPRIKDQKQ